ncbi:hypothetical protein [Pseudomonas sp. dw_358]|uniref:hypothetical protein n=1 Tax=Pseudomonas sp. dw_358 TaxID=2720083 RepID=UPI001BD62518|nr:hypothetical protein [Pseudomonas sp. dw_358]
MKNLNMMCLGDKISFENFSSIFLAAGVTTDITLTMPQALPQAELQALLRSAGPKKLTLQIPGAIASVRQITALLGAATGSGTKVGLSSVDSQPPAVLQQIANFFVGKEWSMTIDGATASSIGAVAAINIFTDSNTSRTISALNALPAAGVDEIVAAIGSKTYTVMLDGALSTPGAIIDCVRKLKGSNVEVSLTNGGSLSTANLSQVLDVIGSKKGAFSVDVLELNPTRIMSVLGSAGPDISISILSAHTLSTTELDEILRLTTGKKLLLEFNGRQLGVDPVNGDKLQRVVAASTTDITIAVNTAQYPPLSYLLPIIQSAGNTNLVVLYNGGQLTDTEAHGNVVVRAIEVAPATTTVAVVSVGDGNYSVANYLEIVRTAG